MKFREIILTSAVCMLSWLTSSPAEATLTWSYQNVPTTLLQADDTFTVDLILQNDGSFLKAANLKPEIEPNDAVFVTNIVIASGTTSNYVDNSKNRLLVQYGGAGNNSGTIQIAQVTFQVSQCPAVAAATLTLNPLSVAINTPVIEATNMIEQRFPLTLEIKNCAPPATPTPTASNGVGDGSYETTEFEENQISSTSVAGCAVGTTYTETQFGTFILMIMTVLLLMVARRPKFAALSFMAVVTLFASSAEARIYHVDNSHPSACTGATCVGDQNTPYASIAEVFANRFFVPGDEIFIHQGTYNESVEITVNANGNGLPGLPIRIRGETDAGGNNLVTINGGTQPGLILKFLISYWTIQNLNFVNGGPFTVNVGIVAPPSALLLYLVGQQINVINNNFSGTVSGSSFKTAIHLSTATSFQPTDIYNGHLVKNNFVNNMNLSGSSSAAIDLLNFDYSFAQNNRVINSNAASSPNAAIRVNDAFRSVVDRNALLINLTPGFSDSASLVLNNPRRMSIHNNILFSRSNLGGGGSSDDFLGSILLGGFGSSADINRIHHNSIVNDTVSPGTADARRSGLMVLDYGNSKNYSDFVNNVMGTLSAAGQSHFLWTGAYTTNQSADTTKRVFIDYNTISNRFYSDAPNIPGAPLAAPLYADRLSSNSLHDQNNNAADFGVVCAELNNTVGLPVCKRRDYVAYAGSPLAAVPFYLIDYLFGDAAQTFTDHNLAYAGNGGTHFTSAAADPFNPANYTPGTFATGANGQARCSDISGNINASCDAVSGHMGGPAELQYTSFDNISYCSPDPAEQLDVYPTLQEPDRRLTAADYVKLLESGQNSLAAKVGDYLVTLNTTQLSCP